MLRSVTPKDLPTWNDLTVDTPTDFDMDIAVSRSPDVARAVEAERLRILAILDLGGQHEGHAPLLRQCISDGTSVQAAALKLLAEIQSRGVTLAQLRADASPAVPRAGAFDGPPGGRDIGSIDPGEIAARRLADVQRAQGGQQ